MAETSCLIARDLAGRKMTWTYILGICFILWSVWELADGRAWLHRAFHRETEPVAFWIVWAIWLLLGISMFYW